MAKGYARSLRRNMTDAERLLWQQLRNRQMDGWKFRRQHPLGPFVVDFICLDKKIIVEVDGSQHAIHIKEDAERSRCLQEWGYRILRFWNNDVLKGIDSVLEVIYRELSEDPLTSPLPRGGEESEDKELGYIRESTFPTESGKRKLKAPALSHYRHFMSR
jgi:very-short-patch-repair endonuclease